MGSYLSSLFYSQPQYDFDGNFIYDDHSLWLSSHHPARDLTALQKMGITHILSITHEEAIHFPDKVSNNIE